MPAEGDAALEGTKCEDVPAFEGQLRLGLDCDVLPSPLYEGLQFTSYEYHAFSDPEPPRKTCDGEIKLTLFLLLRSFTKQVSPHPSKSAYQNAPSVVNAKHCRC